MDVFEHHAEFYLFMQNSMSDEDVYKEPIAQLRLIDFSSFRAIILE